MNNIEDRYKLLIDKFNSKKDTHNNIVNVWIPFLHKYYNNLFTLIKQGENVVDKLENNNINDIDEDIINQLLILFG